MVELGLRFWMKSSRRRGGRVWTFPKWLRCSGDYSRLDFFFTKAAFWDGRACDTHRARIPAVSCLVCLKRSQSGGQAVKSCLSVLIVAACERRDDLCAFSPLLPLLLVLLLSLLCCCCRRCCCLWHCDGSFLLLWSTCSMTVKTLE